MEISTAYLNAARQEAARKGLAERIRFVHGDFVSVADEVPPADIVTLNRVLCCYPDYETLAMKSAARARKYYGLVFPRDGWIIRQGVKVMNWMFRARKSLYVAYIHPAEAVDQVIRASGFERVYQKSTLGWHVWVYERR